MNTDVHLISDGDWLAVIGDKAAVDRFLEHLGLLDQSVPFDGPSLGGWLRAGSIAADAASLYAANAGRWLKLTEQSRLAVAKFGRTPTTTPGIDYAMAGQRGAMKAWLQVESGVGTLVSNPAFLSGIAGALSQLALQHELAQIKTYLETVLKQGHDILSALDDAELANVRGARRDIEDAMRMYEQTGRVDAVTWSTVQTRGGTITNEQEWARLRLEGAVTKIGCATNVGELLGALTSSAGTIRVAVGVLAYQFETQDMFDVLRLNRLREISPDDFDGHVAALNANRQSRRDELLGDIEAMMDAIIASADVATADTLLHPKKTAAAIESVNRTVDTLDAFLAVFEVESNRQALVAPAWLESAKDPHQLKRAATTIAPTAVVAGAAGAGLRYGKPFAKTAVIRIVKGALKSLPI